jgi:hypothetical protein
MHGVKLVATPAPNARTSSQAKPRSAAARTRAEASPGEAELDAGPTVAVPATASATFKVSSCGKKHMVVEQPCEDNTARAVSDHPRARARMNSVSAWDLDSSSRKGSIFLGYRFAQIHEFEARIEAGPACSARRRRSARAAPATRIGVRSPACRDRVGAEALRAERGPARRSGRHPCRRTGSRSQPKSARRCTGWRSRSCRFVGTLGPSSCLLVCARAASLKRASVRGIPPRHRLHIKHE